MRNIYLINQEDTSLYKIGPTKKDPKIRLKELQTGNGNPLLLIKFFVTEFDFKFERALHLYFKNKMYNSEWFNLTEEDVINFESTCNLYESNFKIIQNGKKFI